MVVVGAASGAGRIRLDRFLVHCERARERVIFFSCSDCQRGLQGLIQVDGVRDTMDGGHVARHVGFAQGSVGG